MSRRVQDLRGRALLVSLIEQLSRKNGNGAWRIFSDFCAMSAIAISNAVDLAQRETREAEYMRLVKQYTPEDVQLFPQMLGALVEELESGMTDCLGSVFHDLELHNKYAGQYFSPYHLCRMMASMTVMDADATLLAKRGYFTASEPAAGSGAMVIAICDELQSQRINYQQALHVTAVDVDLKCVHMCYTQLALLHVPAVVVHGNALTLEEWSHWYTPAHILGLWGSKLFRARAEAPPPKLTDEQVERPKLLPTIAAASGPLTPEKRSKKRPDQLTLF